MNRLFLLSSTLSVVLSCLLASCGKSDKPHDSGKIVKQREVPSIPEPQIMFPESAESTHPDFNSPEIRHSVTGKIFKGDLPALKKRRFLRVLTRNNLSCYFIHRGISMGFEYELVKKFAKEQGMDVVMVVPPEWDDMIPWLLEGRGDIIAGSMAMTKQRKEISGLSFCKSYSSLVQAVFCRKNDSSIKSLADLKGREIFVRKKSVYWETLCELRRKGVSFILREAPQTMETDDILRAVRDGKFDLTVADRNFINLKHLVNGLAAPLTVGEELRYAWGVRQENRALQRAVNDFFKREYRGKFYNILYKRYFVSRSYSGKYKNSAAEKSAYRFSKYDKIIQKYAAKYKMPPHLIAAQIFQESRFDPKAKSWCGTIGLMQLTKITAKEMKCRNIYDPEENIKAGVKYMKKLYSRMPDRVDDFNRICFSLASYNGGYGHLLDARKLAKKQNLDPDKWFNNVENAMKLLSHKKYYSKAKYGYCRSSEIVNYVKDITVRSREYKQALAVSEEKK